MDPSLEITRADSDALDACLEIRRRVFVEGQGVPLELEMDGREAECLHWLARRAGLPVGTARLRFPEGEAKAERVAVLDACRGAGVGRALMDALEDEARGRGHDELILHAQEPVIAFYERLGYRARGVRFFEADIAHVAMSKDLSARS